MRRDIFYGGRFGFIATFPFEPKGEASPNNTAPKPKAKEMLIVFQSDMRLLLSHN